MKKLKKQKILILRLSSLGDLILSTSALSALLPWREGLEIHWVVAKEFAEVLKDHSWIDVLHVFDRRAGLKGWLRLVRQLWKNHYLFVYDLHASLRTQLLMGLFLFWKHWEAFWKPSLRRKLFWRVIPKQRWKFYGYCFFKSYWPSFLHPTPWVVRYAECVGGTGAERPQFHFLVEQAQKRMVSFQKLLPKNYLCVMPSTKWDGKKWPIASYIQWIEKSKIFPVILGTYLDRESLQLVRLLEERQLPHFSGIGIWNLAETAWVLAHSQGYVGSDTGLAHLAEAVGARAWILYGPTVPQLGFGPWREESRSVGLPLVCRPCSKDGQWCYRFWDQRACLKKLTPEQLLESMMDS